MNKRTTGAAYEKLAGAFLEQQGYKVIAYNFRCRLGEIDVIAKDDGYLVFVEVKYRKTDEVGNPLEAVTKRKQQIISRVANYYCLTHGYGETEPCRFDVVAIWGERIKVVKNAFEYQG